MRQRKLYWSNHLRHLTGIVLTWGVLTMLLGCSSPGQTAILPSQTAAHPPTQVTTSQPPVQVTTRVITTGLQIPWGLAFLPDGRALVSERASGRLLTITASGQKEEVQRLPSTSNGEGGLLGITLSPNYATDGLVYAYYSTKTDNRIVRFHLKETPQPILTGIPAAGIHNGGRIAFGPDGMLYAGTGDASIRDNSQNLASLGAKFCA